MSLLNCLLKIKSYNLALSFEQTLPNKERPDATIGDPNQVGCLAIVECKGELQRESKEFKDAVDKLKTQAEIAKCYIGILTLHSVFYVFWKDPQSGWREKEKRSADEVIDLLLRLKVHEDGAEELSFPPKE